MDDAMGMGVLQGSADLAGEAQRLWQGLGRAVVQRRTGNQLDNDIGHRVLDAGHGCLACIINGDDVGMVELSG